MAKTKYANDAINDDHMRVIGTAVGIIEDFYRRGYDLTLRQLYYQFVGHDHFPDDRRWSWTGSRYVKDENGTKNADPNYKWLGGIIDKARMNGLIDWKMIVDRTREKKENGHWDNPNDLIAACADQFQYDKWEDQEYRPEVWIEKDALIGVIEGVCKALDVVRFSCRGYSSQSAMWGAAQRLLRTAKSGQTPIIIHLGDHDPSGVDMTRDIGARLATFGIPLEVNRIALNMDQVEEYDPPPNPAKLTDSRCRGYIEEYGDESWELDALDPDVLSGLVRETIIKYREDDEWDKAVRREQAARERLASISDDFDEIVAERGY